MAIKPTKWEMPLCPYCRSGQLGLLTWGSLGPIPYCSVCDMVRPDCFPPMIQGSAPPFVPMSDRPVPRDEGEPEIFLPALISKDGIHFMSSVEAYETRLAHLCGLIARRREKEFYDYREIDPAVDCLLRIDALGTRTLIALRPSTDLNVRFVTGALFGADAETTIINSRFTALRGAALRGRA